MNDSRIKTQGLMTQGWITQGWISNGWMSKGWMTQRWMSKEWMTNEWKTKGWMTPGWEMRDENVAAPGDSGESFPSGQTIEPTPVAGGDISQLYSQFYIIYLMIT